MTGPLQRAAVAVNQFVRSTVMDWRTGTTGGQLAVLWILIGTVVVMTAVSLRWYAAIPLVSFFIPVVVGTLLLRFKPLVGLYAVTFACMVITVTVEGLSFLRGYSIVLFFVAAAIMLIDVRSHRSGLPGPIGEAMFVDLRKRLEAQGRVPQLPVGWHAESALKSAGGVDFAGDFVVCAMSPDQQRLDTVLVDVCGKGVTAGTQALHFAGALSGLLGALPPGELFCAANDFLLRQEWGDGFATAVHAQVDLTTGEYSVVSAGHPPALRWDVQWTEWVLDSARGMALGVSPQPEFFASHGTLQPGDALLFFTDGVIEGHSFDLDESLDWLTEQATNIVHRTGFDGLTDAVLARVERSDDDRAALLIARRPMARFAD